MIKLVHNENLIQYEFIEKLDRVTYNTSVYLWIHKNRAILIDCGYARFAEQIKKDLVDNNIIIEKIIITHYHRDHAEGSVVFNEAEIIASSNYRENFNKCINLSRKGLFYKNPDILVSDELSFKFYNSNFKIYETPGHTPCGLSVLVDDEYLFVSDMLLNDIDGKMIIPYIDMNSSPSDHIDTLNKYSEINPKHLLLTHGKPKFNIEVNDILKERLYYLEKFVNGQFKCNLEDCLLNDISKYSMTEIHKLNQRNAKKHVSAQLTSFV